MYQTNSTYQILINKGCTRYLSVIGDLEHELPLAVPVFHHIAGLQRNAHKQVRSDHTHRTKLEGIQGRGSGGSQWCTTLGSARKSCTDRSMNSSHESTYTITTAVRDKGGTARLRCAGGVVGSGWCSCSN